MRNAPRCERARRATSLAASAPDAQRASRSFQVFCYKCGGCLTAKEGTKACDCGHQDQANLRAHEGAHNHNNPGPGLQAGLQPAGLHGHVAALQGMAAALGMPWPFGGGGGVPQPHGGGRRRR